MLRRETIEGFCEPLGQRHREDKDRSMRSALKAIIVVGVLAALVVGGYVLYKRRSTAPAMTLRTAAVERGDLLVTIGATGTVEPEEVIDVGAQVAGQINYFGKDR